MLAKLAGLFGGGCVSQFLEGRLCLVQDLQGFVRMSAHCQYLCQEHPDGTDAIRTLQLTQDDEGLSQVVMDVLQALVLVISSL